MESSTRNRILLVVAGVLVALVVGAGAWFLRAPVANPVVALPPPPGPIAPPVEPQSTDGARRELELVDAEPADYASLETTVIHPLEVELELVRASATPQADGAPALGAGATARLVGSVVDARSAGVRAEVRFVAGPNTGRTLYSDSLGRFGADALNPGLSIVTISGPGIVGAKREVRLRPQRETQLNVGFGRPARVFAEVFDKDGKPVAGAIVEMDGQVRETTEEGLVEFAAVAPGDVLVVVTKPGFASVRQVLALAGAATIERGRFKFRLDPAASLSVSITNALNAGQQALLFVLPVEMDAERKYPWHLVNPVRIWPGGTALVEDLPEARVLLRLYHAGAAAKPARREVELQRGARRAVEFELEPASVVTGVVTDGNGPAAGAVVRLEAPDRTAAMLSVFGQTSFLYLEGDVLPDLPPAVQDATTNERGEYQLTASEEVSAVRYLTALSKDGKRIAHAVLRPGDLRADLALAPVAAGNGELVIQMDGRIQPLPVEVRVDGAPRDPFVLPLGRDLRVSGLPEGSWKATVRWKDDVVLRDQPLEIRGESRLYLALPEGAIVGQSAEERRRAGKR